MRFQSFRGLTPVRLPARAIAFVLGMTLMTSCVTSDGGQNTPDDSGDDQVDQQDSEQPSGKDQPPEDPVAQSITSSTKIGTNFRVEVISLDKHDDDFAVVRFSMANLSDSEDAYTLTPPKDRDNPLTFSR